MIFTGFMADVLQVNDALSNCNTVVFPGKSSARNCLRNDMYFCCLGTTQHTYQFKVKNGKTVMEDVIADVKDNYVQYHLEDKGSEVWVINDFNRVSIHYTGWTRNTSVSLMLTKFNIFLHCFNHAKIHLNHGKLFHLIL